MMLSLLTGSSPGRSVTVAPFVHTRLFGSSMVMVSTAVRRMSGRVSVAGWFAPSPMSCKRAAPASKRAPEPS